VDVAGWLAGPTGAVLGHVVCVFVSKQVVVDVTTDTPALGQVSEPTTVLVVSEPGAVIVIVDVPGGETGPLGYALQDEVETTVLVVSEPGAVNVTLIVLGGETGPLGKALQVVL
jgi:hypothetical protein